MTIECSHVEVSDRLLTTDQAGELLGVAGVTVRRMIRDGEIESVKLRGARRVKASVIAALIADLR